MIDLDPSDKTKNDSDPNGQITEEEKLIKLEETLLSEYFGVKIENGEILFDSPIIEESQEETEEDWPDREIS